MNQPLDFNLIKTAGVSQGQFGRLVGVSRITVHSWVKGKMPAKIRERRVRKALDMLKEAIQRGVLPVTENRTEQTQRVLDSMMPAHLRG